MAKKGSKSKGSDQQNVGQADQTSRSRKRKRNEEKHHEKHVEHEDEGKQHSRVHEDSKQQEHIDRQMHADEPGGSRIERPRTGYHGNDGKDLKVHLCNSFPGRKREIEDLLSILGGPCDFLPPLLVHGGPATGKTSIVREVFRHLKRPYAYASCRSCHTLRILFESLMNSLTGHRRTSENNYSSARKCERASDFVELLPSACKQALRRWSKQNENASATIVKPGATTVIYLVIDNVDLVRRWSGGSSLLQVLFKLPELARMPQLGLVLVSTAGPHGYMSGTGCREPIALHFRDYRDDELFQILRSKQSASARDLYSSFLSAVLKPFSRTTRRVTELSEVLDPLFDKYCEPVTEGKLKPGEPGKLFAHIKPHVQRIISGGPQGRTSGSDPVSELHLPSCSKYLLLAAYIASMNPATLDAALFEMGHETKKRRRRMSMSSMEKKDREMHEKQLKGPGSFSLERLLAIFSCIAIDGDGSAHYDNGNVTSDVLMELSTLVSVDLISQGLMDPLEGSPKYRCNADEDMVQGVARHMGFPLSKYLYYNF